MAHQLPQLSDYQMDCLRRFLRFETPIERLHEALHPFITFKIDASSKEQELHYSAAIPENPIRVTKEQIETAVAKADTGEITRCQLKEWAAMVLLNDAFTWCEEEGDEVADLLNHLASSRNS